MWDRFFPEEDRIEEDKRRVDEKRRVEEENTGVRTGLSGQGMEKHAGRGPRKGHSTDKKASTDAFSLLSRLQLLGTLVSILEKHLNLGDRKQCCNQKYLHRVQLSV